MALEKVVYEDNVTVITAAHLNAIQDEIIRVAAEVDRAGDVRREKRRAISPPV